MPVTARLSRKFYETFGDAVVNELVDWMNAVDLGYRNDLLQINEANVARFNAMIELRLGALDARFDKFEARMLRWMLVFWSVSLVSVAGVVAAILQIR